MLLATGSAVGVLRGIPCVAGVLIGMALLIFTVSLGLGSVVLNNATLLLALNIGGAVFLLWLAWRIASADPTTSNKQQKAAGFIPAFTLQWVNPKSWLVTTSAAGTYLSGDAGSAVTQSALLAITFAVAALPSAFTWLTFGAAVSRFLSNERRTRIFNVSMGLLLAASVFMIVL